MEDDEDEIQVLSIWKKNNRMSHLRTNQAGDKSGGYADSKRFKASQSKLEWEEPPGWLEAWANKFITRPGSSKRLLWDWLTLLFICYDIVTIPLETFGPLATSWARVMRWACVIFWSLDIPCSFLVGFQDQATVRMNLQAIASHYVRTWLGPDLLTIIIDWAYTIVWNMYFSELPGVGGDHGQLYEALSFLRIVRLLRLRNVPEILSNMGERISREVTIIMVGIMQLLFFILLINHIIACVWYSIGTWNVDQFEDTWVRSNGLLDHGVAYRYATSLHWSLTQFTPASMEVAPTNERERLFGVLVLVFAMVTFSSFVSSITNAMTRLRMVNKERHDQLILLRRYLAENHVTGSMMVRLWGTLNGTMSKSKRRLHEKDIRILQLLPWGLKSELHEEVYAPILALHPFFDRFIEVFPGKVRKVYNTGLEEISLPNGEDIFNAGDVAETMYFVRSGILSYNLEANAVSDAQSWQIVDNSWLSEPVLWIKWKHRGQLIGDTHCELVALKAARVQSILDQNVEAARYARHFARYFKEYPDMLTDIYSDMEVLERFAVDAFSGEEEDVNGSNRSWEKHVLGAVPEAQEEESASRGFFGNFVKVLSKASRISTHSQDEDESESGSECASSDSEASDKKEQRPSATTCVVGRPLKSALKGSNKDDAEIGSDDEQGERSPKGESRDRKTATIRISDSDKKRSFAQQPQLRQELTSQLKEQRISKLERLKSVQSLEGFEKVEETQRRGHQLNQLLASGQHEIYQVHDFEGFKQVRDKDHFSALVPLQLREVLVRGQSRQKES
eukprot:gnl/TRDRNA2_/TRDRNA2_147621_c0_seq1.p1 gnl/TRDRNA2_/TRDRNA2_147621_c0~~gnl/TRDRNA2_/TRDRNA2_147621_c0_seq1.p1  ORF type:complete len:830 (+),score=140.89 gnl/TRDRNA2_/TRDRNA2_147621_c0_seq1:119-2491(+)